MEKILESLNSNVTWQGAAKCTVFSPLFVYELTKALSKPSSIFFITSGVITHSSSCDSAEPLLGFFGACGLRLLSSAIPSKICLFPLKWRLSFPTQALVEKSPLYLQSPLYQSPLYLQISTLSPDFNLKTKCHF